MGISYTYPRVDVSTTALARQTYTEAIEDTLVLFVPFKSGMGPIDEIKRIHSLSEFEETYGAITFESFGTTGLTIRNWLNNGGTVYALRHDITTKVGDYAAGTCSNGTLLGDKYAIGYDAVKFKSFLNDKIKNGKDDNEKTAAKFCLDIFDVANQFNFTFKSSGQLYFQMKADGDTPTHYIMYNTSASNNIIVAPQAPGTAIDKNNLHVAFQAFADAVGLYVLDQAKQTFITKFTEKDNAFLKDLMTFPDGAGASTEEKMYFIPAYYTTNKNRQLLQCGIFGCNSGENGSLSWSEKLRVVSKYPGAGYNNFTIQTKVTKVDLSTPERTAIEYSVSVFNGPSLIERFNIARDKIKDLFAKDNVISDYIYLGDKNKEFTALNYSVIETVLDKVSYCTSGSTKIRMLSGKDSEAPVDDLINDVYTIGDNKPWINQLKNTLEFPIDFIIDPGYPYNVKEAIYKAFCDENTGEGFIRNDINVLMSHYDLMSANAPTDCRTDVNSLSETSNTRNLSKYSQYYKILDPIGGVNHINITPTVAMAHLLSYNAITLNQGTHQPIAGLNRGVVEGVVAVNENPLPEKKEEYFNERTNYTEVSRYNTAIMSQRTYERLSDNTALQFLNNSITTNRMVKELEKLARVFLFEYNDATTLANLRKVLNQYIAKYVENRTLQYATIDVQKDPYSEEAIDVMISIKYTNSIEVINIDLIIE